jgi:hypothetical protein
MSIPDVSETDLASCTRVLALQAQARHSIPIDLAEQAARATRDNLSGSVRHPLAPSDHARVSAYFWAVVRRRSVRRMGARSFARATVSQAIAQDLREAGWDQAAISRELERAWG